MTTLLPAVRREVRVKAPQVTAFDVFTKQIGRWWPRVLSAVGGTLAFTDGELEEVSEGESHVWGEVISWERPRGLRMTWRHPTHTADQRTDVGIQFVPDGIETIVRLVQSGWERVPSPAAAAKLYGGDRGWREVLACFSAAVGARA